MPFRDRSEYWNPDTLSYKFLVEAKRLWEIEAHPAYVFYDSNGTVTGPHPYQPQTTRSPFHQVAARPRTFQQ